MVREPIRESFHTTRLHCVQSFKEQLGRLRQHERYVIRLEFAQLDEQRAVEQLQMDRFRQGEQLWENHLDDHVVQRYLVGDLCL